MADTTVPTVTINKSALAKKAVIIAAAAAGVAVATLLIAKKAPDAVLIQDVAEAAADAA